MNRKNIV